MERKELSEQVKAKIRARREVECFAICDRAAWFASLPPSRKKEVLEWRQKCLDATKTGILPKRPCWIR